MTKKKTTSSKENIASKQKYLVGTVSFEHLVNLKKDLKANIKKSRTNFNRAGLIKLFELAYEQAWKILRKILKEHYSIEEVIGSKDTFREAAKVGLINDCEKWLEFVKDRNQTVHTYNPAVANHIIDDLENFIAELEILIQNLNNLRKKFG